MNSRDQLGKQIEEQHLKKGLEVVEKISINSKDEKRKSIFASILQFFSSETEEEKQEREARELQEEKERKIEEEKQQQKRAQERKERLERDRMNEEERKKHDEDEKRCNQFVLQKGIKQKDLENNLKIMEQGLHYKKCSNNLQEQILNLIEQQDDEKCNEITNKLTNSSNVDDVEKELKEVEGNLLGDNKSCKNHNSILKRIEEIKEIQEKELQNQKEMQEKEAENQLKDVCDTIETSIISQKIKSLKDIGNKSLNKLTKKDIGISDSNDKVCGHDTYITAQANSKKPCMIKDDVKSDACENDFQTLVTQNSKREDILEKLKNVIKEKQYDEYETIKTEYINTSPDKKTVNIEQHNEIIDHLKTLRVKKWDHFCSTIEVKINKVTLETWDDFATIQKEYKAEEESIELESKTFGTQTQYFIFTSHILQYKPLDIDLLIEKKKNDIKEREIKNILQLPTSNEMRTSYDNLKSITSIDSIPKVDQQLKKLEQEEQNEKEIKEIEASVESSSIEKLAQQINTLNKQSNLKHTQKDNIDKLKKEVKEKFEKETEQLFNDLSKEIQNDLLTEENIESRRQNVKRIEEENKNLSELQKKKIEDAKPILNDLSKFVDDKYYVVDDFIAAEKSNINDFDKKNLECVNNLLEIEKAFENRTEETTSRSLSDMITCNDIPTILQKIDEIIELRKKEEEICEEKLKEFMNGFSEDELKKYMDKEGKLCPVKTLEKLNEMHYQRAVQINVVAKTIEDLKPIVKQFKILKDYNVETVNKTSKYIKDVEGLISNNLERLKENIEKFAKVKKHQEDVLKKHGMDNKNLFQKEAKNEEAKKKNFAGTRLT